MITRDELDCFATVSNDMPGTTIVKPFIKAPKDWGSENLTDQDLVDLLLEEQKLGRTLSDSDLAFIVRVRGVR